MDSFEHVGPEEKFEIFVNYDGNLQADMWQFGRLSEVEMPDGREFFGRMLANESYGGHSTSIQYDGREFGLYLSGTTLHVDFRDDFGVYNYEFLIDGSKFMEFLQANSPELVEG